ncbi:ADP-dependent phosphofructokinase/glucokinase [Kaistia soli DSM 19436]|uniref:ADP-dependent phosphofructokinase/glucokinase n=1 Tax=Kaistia soli DSM 19436 TaxID=1122133 RepID=A0A1M4U647_9HYPH|nr:ADP-dependent glucokinase/phosphofructokinase [Kaistia soli]SHE52114.1 ADP-dependent phosphofructokinase/glucokinase [Kaistia soli DSM 19436]
MSEADWQAGYERFLPRFERYVGAARLVLCGFSACIDSRFSLAALADQLGKLPTPEAEDFVGRLLARAAAGVGGEFREEWPAGPALLASVAPPVTAFGGTGPHIAWALGTLGASGLVALADRSAYTLGHVDRSILLAEGDRAVPASEATRRGLPRPPIHVFEYHAGRPMAGRVPPRSSRIIVRFEDPGLEHDPDFDRLSVALAGDAGAAVVSGFNGVALADMGRETERIGALVDAWRARGVATVHLELAGYATTAARDAMLARLGTRVTSLGMSLSELNALADPAESIEERLIGLGEDFGLRRITVHADEWVASATLDDPALERDALMAGALIASCRAEAGVPIHPRHTPDGAHFLDPPLPVAQRFGRWSVVAVAAPYLRNPKTTLGLGDTFTAGCLLALASKGGAAIAADERIVYPGNATKIGSRSIHGTCL